MPTASVQIQRLTPCVGLNHYARQSSARASGIYGQQAIAAGPNTPQPEFSSSRTLSRSSTLQAEPALSSYPLASLASSLAYLIATATHTTNNMTRTTNPPVPPVSLPSGGTARLTRQPHPQSTLRRVRTYSLSQSRRSSAYGSQATLHLSWLLRSNLSGRRSLPSPTEIQKRNFFGMGEIIGVLANPSETLRSLTESKRMLEETRRELSEARERAQIGPTHTFSPLPGFFDRPAELKAIERALKGEPSFTVLFGASSVGKTALLRQVLTRPEYHVLHFDLRIAGFADLASLYMSLSQQMESFFMNVAEDPDMPGYESFEKEAWAFKHDRLNVERRVANAANGDGPGASLLGDIKTSDIARLMELFQSSLLKYWNFQPALDTTENRSSKASSENTAHPPERRQSQQPQTSQQPSGRSASRLLMFWRKRKRNEIRAEKENGEANNGPARQSGEGDGQEKPAERRPPVKKMPIFFIDEAHKLPALIRSTAAMKCLLDAMLVLTKQDRLCHVIHATSDPFYQTWLRQLNVMQHCKILTIGDYPKADTRRYFRERILPTVPENLRAGLDFEKLYEAFGGKLAHWQDYIADYVNANGRLDIKQSSHFLQAHALLNLHVIHSAQAAPSPGADDSQTQGNTPSNQNLNSSQHTLHRPPQSPATGAGFRIYSPLTANPHAAPPALSPTEGDPPEDAAEYTALQLLKVMNRLIQPGTRALSYFLLCREFGARAVDAMVRGRILDLRWTDPISREGWDPRALSMRVRESVPARRNLASSSGTAVNDHFDEEDGEMYALSEEEIMRFEREWEMQGAEEEEQIVGPKLVPLTPIMRFAMKEVVMEYLEDDDDRTTSEYASLSGVEEY
ncbi:hypothetical protein K474DRAFT_1657845 [Panus rudis PR-1116 ss-1]|nr:hypothetical protein K474DRAFT_1657845 [Panus rudis PR-1116 ss-1]